MYKEASGIWNKINYGDSVAGKKIEMEANKKMFDLFHVGDYYYYIFNLQE